MAIDEVVRARIDSGLKKEASAVLSAMGLSLSDAIRLLLIRLVSDKAFPFDLRIPNAETQAAMRESRSGKVKRFGDVAELRAHLDVDD